MSYCYPSHCEAILVNVQVLINYCYCYMYVFVNDHSQSELF